MKLSTKEKAKKIRAYKEGITEGQTSPGFYISRVGRKYVYILNTWSANEPMDKIEINKYFDFIPDEWQK